jgi:hypothetical protein
MIEYFYPININCFKTKMKFMELNALKDRAEEYKQALMDIDQKRKKWREGTRDLILKTLKQIKNMIPDLNWMVQHVDAGANWETVNILFPTRNSGMKEVTEARTRALIKYQTYLAFSQTYNGDIIVYIVFPYIEDHLSRVTNEVIETISPFNLDENYIVQKVDVFLQKITNWEKGVFQKNNEKLPIESIGFRVPYMEQE